jgi:glycosyltransferase involved in cell wall biosynthesis
MSKPELSIVIPCLNEAASLAACLQKATAFIAAHNINGEIIVADNGSEDESVTIAAQYKTIIIREPEKGYGNAIIAGVNAAQGTYIIMGDADDSYDFSTIMPFLILLREGYDVVIGNRFKGGIQKGAMPFLHRYIGNPVLSFIGKLFFRVNIGDFHCGLRGFSKDSFNKLEIKTTGMEFASEMIVKAALLNMKITETPVILHPDKRMQPSHLRTWRDGWRHLRFLLLYSPRWLFLIPGLILIIFGFISSISLITGPIHIGNKKLDIHTLMYTSCFVLLGFQFISFYIFTKLYAATHGLIPHQQIFIDNFNKYFKLEKGIIVGVLLFVAGVALNIKSFLYWKNTGFNNLDPVKVLRWVIPSVTLILLGMQVILSCFYLSILTIKDNRSSKN